MQVSAHNNHLPPKGAPFCTVESSREKECPLLITLREEARKENAAEWGIFDVVQSQKN
jgi:hypothetical protein